MNMPRRIAAFVLGLAAIGNIGLLAATPALAAAEPACGSGIPRGAVRFYEHAYYTGGYRDFYGNDANWTNNYLTNGINMNDRASSAKNCGTGSTYHIVTMHRDINYNGTGLAPCLMSSCARGSSGRRSELAAADAQGPRDLLSGRGMAPGTRYARTNRHPSPHL
ncbi:MAG: hypothetical protein ACRDTC_28415 [Pseudonocardiaceae bacterium]